MDKKIILISGGSEGLGKAIAAKLSPNHQVIILSRNLEKLQSVASEIGSDYIQADVTDYSSLENAVGKLISKYNRIDVLINNAGVWIEGPLDSNDQKKIQEVINVNTLGTIFLTKAVLPHLKSVHSGRIINIVSQDGIGAKKDHTVYSASKWAITGFTKCLLEDLSHEGIGVTAINPGLIKTNLFEKQGVKRDLNNALDPAEVASLVEYVINLSADTLLPEVSIKNINNPTIMDDTNSSPIGLDINPDLITPQTGIPQAVPASSPAVTPTTGVIDITPGGSGESHSPKTEDITPTGPAEKIPENPGTIPATPATPATVIPDAASNPDTPVITPAPAPTTPPVVSTDATGLEDTRDSSSHLSDIIPGPISAPAAPSAPESVAPAVTPAPITTAPASTATSAPETPAPDTTTPVVQTQVELPPANTSPLAEDPDTVKLVK